MSRFLNARFQGLVAYTPGEQPRDMQYIKLNTNESPYPPAPSVAAALAREDVEDLRLYSDPTAKGLKEALAGLYGLKPENIFVSNGSDEILNFAFMAFGGRGVAYPDISYGFYPVYGRLYGLDCAEIPLKEDFSIDPADYHSLNKMVVIANPNAPTGMSLSLGDIEGILKTNPDGLVLVDEAYVDFGGESALPLLEQYDNLLICRTFSKSRCMAGARLGYAMASPGIIEDLEKIKFSTNPYNVNRLTLKLGEATVAAEDYYREKCDAIIATRARTAQRLKELGFEVLPSHTNFLFARTEKMEGGVLCRALKERGILVRHFDKPRIRDFIRITIGSDDQMDAFVDIVDRIIRPEKEEKL